MDWTEQLGKQLIKEVTFSVDTIKQIKFEDYTIEFNNIVPTWKSLSYSNESYPKISIQMNILRLDNLIYSVKLDFTGHYYCCGSRNFEFEDKDVKKTIIKNSEEPVINILNKSELTKEIFNGTVLEIWKSIIFKLLMN